MTRLGRVDCIEEVKRVVRLFFKQGVCAGVVKNNYVVYKLIRRII